MKTERVVGMVADGVKLESDRGVIVVPWSDLMQGHRLIRDQQSFHIGMHVGMELMREKAANDE